MSNKAVKKLQQMLQGKKKKPVVKTARTVALEGRKHFSSGGTGDAMIKQAQKNYIGSSFNHSSLGGVTVSNKSYDKYYGSLFKPKGFIKS
jgi:D-alanine-D-alanine ligase-like ATP-grasp enzyme